MPARWNFNALPKTAQDATSMARRRGLLPSSITCRVHRRGMKLYEDRGHRRFRCTKRNCSRGASGVEGSFFANTRLQMHTAIGLMYAFTRDWSYEDARHELCDLLTEEEARTELSSGTIAAWYRYCREMVVDHFYNVQQGLPLIGGPGVIVQIDESLFGHRKYNRGRVLDGHWVLGMIDSHSDEVRMVVVERRDAETLLGEITKHVLPGSEIHTDSWRAYDGLSSLPQGYVHKKVNHSDPDHRFVAEDGTHTQQIEATWRPCKDFFRGRSRFGDSNFPERLCEYLWRRYCKKNDIDLFESLLEAVTSQYPI